VRRPEEVDGLDGVHAVVLGSAVYLGRWMPSATSLLGSLREELLERAVWLFSSGPVGDPPRPLDDPTHVVELMRLVRARGHVLFRGSVDAARLTPEERDLVDALRVPTGDFRDWSLIAAWADRMAAVLHASPRGLAESCGHPSVVVGALVR
jgi:menaquinone-dependent protoporphyrinogen oxidase